MELKAEFRLYCPKRPLRALTAADGLREIIKAVDEEYIVDNPFEFSHQDSWWKMPLKPQNRDWRKGIKLHGREDTAPMDVEWTEYDITVLDRSFDRDAGDTLAV